MQLMGCVGNALHTRVSCQSLKFALRLSAFTSAFSIQHSAFSIQHFRKELPMEGNKNLTVSRGEKSVWDRPSLSASLTSYDHERWLVAAWGSGLAMVGARRGGFAGGLLAMLGSTLAVRAAMGHHGPARAPRGGDPAL